MRRYKEKVAGNVTHLLGLCSVQIQAPPQFHLTGQSLYLKLCDVYVLFEIYMEHFMLCCYEGLLCKGGLGPALHCLLPCASRKGSPCEQAMLSRGPRHVSEQLHMLNSSRNNEYAPSRKR